MRTHTEFEEENIMYRVYIYQESKNNNQEYYQWIKNNNQEHYQSKKNPNLRLVMNTSRMYQIMYHTCADWRNVESRINELDLWSTQLIRINELDMEYSIN